MAYILCSKFNPVVANEDKNTILMSVNLILKPYKKKIETTDIEKKWQIVSERVPLNSLYMIRTTGFVNRSFFTNHYF
jgi:hypothetical protein